MDKYEFIGRLDRALDCLSPDEKNAAVGYYKELFEDAGSGKDQELIKNLGTPEAVAENIIRESGMLGKAEKAPEAAAEGSQASQSEPQPSGEKRTQTKKQSAGTILLIVLLLVITCPAWIGGAAAVFGVMVALAAVVFSLLFAAFVAGAALFAAGIATFFTSVGAGLLLFGLGLLFVGIGIVLFVPLCSAVIKLIRGIFNGIISLIRSIFWKREAVA